MLRITIEEPFVGKREVWVIGDLRLREPDEDLKRYFQAEMWDLTHGLELPIGFLNQGANLTITNPEIRDAKDTRKS
jgi:hypothetical protein